MKRKVVNPNPQEKKLQRVKKKIREKELQEQLKTEKELNPPKIFKR